MNPVLLVIAGPNGSGKTTVTVRLRADQWSEGVEYLNPDDIARDRFGDWNSPQATLEAARWTTARREALLAARQGIAFETVFSTDDKLDFVARAKAAGYFVRVFFIGTSDPRINAARIAGRVMAGGHTVPIEKIISRYGRSMANLAGAIEVADRVYIYDNSIDGLGVARRRGRSPPLPAARSRSTTAAPAGLRSWSSRSPLRRVKVRRRSRKGPWCRAAAGLAMRRGLAIRRDWRCGGPCWRAPAGLGAMRSVLRSTNFYGS